MIHIRHRLVTQKSSYPAFSSRNYRELSKGCFVESAAPEGYKDTPLAISGETLAQCIYTSGMFAPPALCSGLGRCGLCRVRFISEAPASLQAEEEALSHHDLENGWRLACRHTPQPGMHVLVPALPFADEESRTKMHAAPVEPAHAGLAVDLGTTSVCWQQTPLEEESFPQYAEGGMTNPQMGAGSDVISRLAFAAQENGAHTLQRLIINALRRTLHALPTHPKELCIAANPAMTDRKSTRLNSSH